MSLVLDKKLYYETVGYRPHAGQHELHYTAARFKVVKNGRRWGKTFWGAREAEPNTFVACRITGEPQKGWIVGPNYVDAEKEFGIVYDSLRKLHVDKESIKFQNNRDSGALHIKTNWGFELVGKSAQHPETLVGEGLNFVLMVEAGRHKRKTWGEYIRPTLSDRRGWAAFTGVPEGKSENSLLYALYQRGQSTRNPQWRSWSRPSWTNNIVFPGGRNDPEILEAEDDLTEDEFARQYGAEFRDKIGSVMQEWDDDIHLGDFNYRADWPLYLANDYGFTNDFVVLWIQEDPVTGNIYVIKEHRYNKIDTPEVCEDLMVTSPGLVRACRMIYPDPAEPDDTYTMEKMLRIPAAGGTGGPLKIRLTLIRSALKVKNRHLDGDHPYRTPTLQVDRSCVKLAWEMRTGYRWPEHKADRKVPRSEDENPLDKDNHGPEALGRYFRGRFGSVSEELGGSYTTDAEMD